MGGHAWWYFVDYQPDINKALQELRQREHQAGRYFPVDRLPKFPVNPNHVPGCKHASINEAMKAADAAGTRSILDMERIGTQPDYGTVVPVEKARLIELFGTDKPKRAMIDSEDDDFDEDASGDGVEELFEDIKRGRGIYIILYANEKPSEIFFAGISYD